MAEPTVRCPNCNTEIKLTESLAAPLLEATKREYEQQLAHKDAAVAKRELLLHDREVTLSKEREKLDEELAAKMSEERPKIAAAEAKKAKLLVAADLEQKNKDLSDLQEVLEANNAKLAVAQKAQADFLQKQRELDDAKRELELTVEKRIQEGLGTVRESAKKEAEDGLKLKITEAELTISSMQKQIEDLKRKAEQGSQQLQGDVQEVELRSLLSAAFPGDSIEAVPKGEFGGDVIHRVNGPLAQLCGTILWESKRTKAWSDGWLPKLRDDQRAAKADIAIIVSEALPKGVDIFSQVEGVCVTSPRTAIPVALMVRSMLVEVALARGASDGQQTKMEMVYQYLTGPRFRQRVEAIVEAFSCMKEDLDKEKKAITKQWAKREEQILRVMQATVGMYGDLQGIAGKTLQQIDGMELPMLE